MLNRYGAKKIHTVHWWSIDSANELWHKYYTSAKAKREQIIFSYFLEREIIIMLPDQSLRFFFKVTAIIRLDTYNIPGDCIFPAILLACFDMEWKLTDCTQVLTKQQQSCCYCRRRQRENLEKSADDILFSVCCWALNMTFHSTFCWCFWGKGAFFILSPNDTAIMKCGHKQNKETFWHYVEKKIYEKLWIHMSFSWSTMCWKTSLGTKKSH